MSRTRQIDLGADGGIITVQCMKARDFLLWNASETEMERTPDGKMIIKTDPEKQVRRTLRIVAACLSSSENVIIDAAYVASLDGPSFKKIYDAFLELNELPTEKAKTFEEQIEEEVGN